jgi:hypothetical protein
MRETIAFNNASNEWVSRYSYTSSCFGWIKDHMVSAPVFTSTQEVLWKHDQNSTTNNSFYGCDPVFSGVSFSFNANPSANKIYKSFSIESPDLLSWPANNGQSVYNTFIVNNGVGNAIKKNVVLNRVNSYGGILYGGVKGIEEPRSNSRVQPVGVIERIVYSADFSGYFGFDPGVSGAGAYVKINGPKSHYSGGDSRLVAESNIGIGVNPDTAGATSKILLYYKGGYFVDSVQSMSEGDPVLIAYRDTNSDQPKGQFADVSVVFGTELDFEAHAFNVDFEPTTLDHNS